MKVTLTHFAVLAALLLSTTPSTELFAQKTTKKGKATASVVEPIEVRTARLDSVALELETAIASMMPKTAERSDGSNQEKVFAFSSGEADNFLCVRNEMTGDNGKTQNCFYLRDGKVFCWVLYREESRNTSPRPRKRLTKYYCENGAVFSGVEKSAPIAEGLDSQAFNALPIAETASMTEFMNRKFQHLLDAFRQGWKATADN